MRVDKLIKELKKVPRRERKCTSVEIHDNDYGLDYNILGVKDGNWYSTMDFGKGTHSIRLKISLREHCDETEEI